MADISARRVQRVKTIIKKILLWGCIFINGNSPIGVITEKTDTQFYWFHWLTSFSTELVCVTPPDTESKEREALTRLQLQKQNVCSVPFCGGSTFSGCARDPL